MKTCQILVVEDDPEVGELIVEALSMELDCDVKLIADGSIALEWLKSDQYRLNVVTLIILDIHLPGVSGLDILEYVKSHERFQNARVVMQSSDSDLLEHARGKADLVLPKAVAYTHFLDITRWYRRGVEQHDGRRGARGVAVS